jgi:hypothetical protein
MWFFAVAINCAIGKIRQCTLDYACVLGFLNFQQKILAIDQLNYNKRFFNNVSTFLIAEDDGTYHTPLAFPD